MGAGRLNFRENHFRGAILVLDRYSGYMDQQNDPLDCLATHVFRIELAGSGHLRQNAACCRGNCGLILMAPAPRFTIPETPGKWSFMIFWDQTYFHKATFGIEGIPQT